MGSIESPAGRSVIQDVGMDLVILVPSKKNWFVLLFLGAWLFGWVYGLVSALEMLKYFDVNNPGAELFTMVWLVGWTIGGAFAIYIFLWGLVGKERMTLDGRVLRLKRDIWGFGKTRRYPWNEVKNLRPNEEKEFFGSWKWGMSLYGLGAGSIAFDYGMKTVKFATALDPPEVHHILEKIHSRFGSRELQFQ